MPQTIEYIPARAPRRRGIRFRIILSFGLMSALCVLMAFDTFGILRSINPANLQIPQPGWTMLALFTGAPAVITALLSFLATGRPW